MEIRVLGPIDVVHGSRSVDLGTRMHRAVLSLLVLDRDRVVSLDRLIDGLWGDDPPATATNALHVYISGLRKALEPGRAPGAPVRVLVTQAPGYVLRLPAREIDAARFELLTTEGQALLDAGRPTTAYDVLGLALTLWRGSPFGDLGYETFLQPEIARLNELRAIAAETRAEAMLARGPHPEAVAAIDTLVAEDPLRERRWGLLALALYRDGRQADALRALSRARRTLGEELGLDLGPELRRLEDDIFAHSPSLDWRPPSEKPPTPARRVPLRHANGGVMQALFSEVVHAAGEPTIEGSVLPADRCPLGVSLTEMGALVAPFTISGSDLSLYPDTPFQVLYVEDVHMEMVGLGILASGAHSFSVLPGTYFYVSLFSVNNQSPVVPGFPSAPSEAAAHLFDPAQYGARDFEVVIDGRSTAIGPEYVTGPVAVPGEEGTQAVTIGAFVGPMSSGTHTVTIRGGAFGRGQADTFGVSFVLEEFTYTIEVGAG